MVVASVLERRRPLLPLKQLSNSHVTLLILSVSYVHKLDAGYGNSIVQLKSIHENHAEEREASTNLLDEQLAMVMQAIKLWFRQVFQQQY